MTAEYAASDDAQALASLCERVKVKADVTEKFSSGTFFVFAGPRRHAEIGAARASGGEGCVIVKCDHIEFVAKKFVFMDLYGELTQITGCNLGEKEWWRRVGFEANYEDIRGIIKVELGKCGRPRDPR